MNRAVEFHDSVLEGVTVVGTEVILFLRAYVQQSDGIPGVDAGTGWIQAVTVRFLAGTLEGNMPDVPADISSGKLMVGNNERKELLSLPLVLSDPLTLHLILMNGELRIQGSGLELMPVGEPVFVEAFS
jgi:hypothetical protein